MPRAIKLSILCMALLVSSSLAPAEDISISGNDKGLWLVRRNVAENSFDVLAKPIDGKWQWVDHGRTGRPAAVVALGGKLHVLLDPTGYLIFDPDSDNPLQALNPNDPRWPDQTPPLAACEAVGFGDVDEEGAALVVVVPRSARATATATADDLQPAPLQLEDTVNLAVFQYANSTWTYVTELENAPLGKDIAVHLTAVDRRLYLMFRPTAQQPNRLAVWSEGHWSDVDLEGPTATAPVLGMLAVKGRLAIVLSVAAEAPARRGIQIATVDQAGNITALPVTHANTAATWAEADPPRIARLADRVAMVWHEDSTLKFATCELNGQLLGPAEVEILSRPPLDGRGAEIIAYFMYGVLAAIFIPMFLLRQRRPIKPFTLPNEIVPGNLFKRLMAALIDLAPFIVMPAMSEPELRALAEYVRDQRLLPTGFGYAYVITMVCYLGYCVLMELNFSATLGKMIFKLRVVGDEGKRAGLREVLLRNLVKIVELYWVPLLPLLAIFVVFSRNRQRLGDLMARTTVVDAKTRPAPPTEQEDDRDVQSPSPPDEH